MKKTPTAAKRGRARRAIEGLGVAGECIGPITPGLSLFVVTHGQISMIDVITHVLDCLGPSRVSVWTWTIATYEADVFRGFMADGRVLAGLLVVDANIKAKTESGSRNGTVDDPDSVGARIVGEWGRQFGEGSVRLVKNHAKIATVEGSGMKVLIRGSMNLNFNPRLEQFDLTEGGVDFDLVRQLEGELEALEIRPQSTQPVAVSGFPGVSMWKP